MLTQGLTNFHGHGLTYFIDIQGWHITKCSLVEAFIQIKPHRQCLHSLRIKRHMTATTNHNFTIYVSQYVLFLWQGIPYGAPHGYKCFHELENTKILHSKVNSHVKINFARFPCMLSHSHSSWSLSAEMWCHVDWQIIANVSEGSAVSIFRVKNLLFYHEDGGNSSL